MAILSTNSISSSNNNNIPKLTKASPDYNKEIAGNVEDIKNSLSKLNMKVPNDSKSNGLKPKVDDTDKKVNKFSTFITDSLGKFAKTTETTLQNSSEVLLKSLGPVSLLFDPIKDLTGIDVGDKLPKGISGIFEKKKFKGQPKRNKVLPTDPGSVMLLDFFGKRFGYKPDKETKGLKLSPKMLLSLLGGGLIAGGIASYISGLFDDGPFKGLKKLAGHALTDIGKFILVKTKGLFFGLLDNMIKPFKGLLDKLVKPFKGLLDNMIKPFSGLLDNLIKGIGGKILGKTVGKTGGKSFLKLITKKLGPKLDKFVKFLKGVPLLGAVISTGFAISRFKKGDVVGGLLDLASGIASIFPGIGTAISYGIEFISAARDLGAFKEGGVIKVNVLKIMGDFFKKIGKGFASWFGGLFTALKNGFIKVFDNTRAWITNTFNNIVNKAKSIVSVPLNFVNNIFDNIKTGFQDFKADPKEFLTSIFNSVTAKVTGFFNGIGRFIDFLVQGVKNPIEFGKSLTSKGFGGAFKEYELEKQQSTLTNFKTSYGNIGDKRIDDALNELKIAQQKGEVLDTSAMEMMFKDIVRELNEAGKKQQKTQVNNINNNSSYDSYQYQKSFSYGY